MDCPGCRCVRTYRISVFADDARKAWQLASEMQTLQLAKEGKVEDIEVTDIHVEGDEDDERNSWDGDDEQEGEFCCEEETP